MTTPEEQAAVLEANASFYRAFESLDLAKMEDVWSTRDPISCIHPGWKLVSGRTGVMGSWSSIFQATKSISFELADVRAMVRDTFAWVVLFEQITAKQLDGQVQAYALSTNTFSKEDGVWRLVHHHASPAPAPPTELERVGESLLH